MNEHSNGTRATVQPSATASGTTEEAKLNIDDQWFYRGNRSRTWLACNSLPNGKMGCICEKVPSEVWPILERVVQLEALRTTEGNARENASDAGSGINKEVVAPDQGSVRNATDELDAKRYRWLKPLYTGADFEYGECSEGTTPSIVFAIPPGSKWSGDLDKSIDAAIRALPVLEK